MIQTNNGVCLIDNYSLVGETVFPARGLLKCQRYSSITFMWKSQLRPPLSLALYTALVTGTSDDNHTLVVFSSKPLCLHASDFSASAVVI